jgi:outer membrane lipoprotein-sorting protein
MMVKAFKTSCLSLMACFWLCPALPAAATTSAEQSAASMVAPLPGAREGKQFLTALLEKVQSIPSYNFESSLVCYTENKPVTETGRFYFKNPNLVRFEAVSAGKLSGSVVVRQADGKVRAKSKAFFGMTVGLSPRSKLLQTPNGYNILDSDLATLISTTIKSLDGDLKCLVTASPAPYPGLERAYILEVMHGPDSVVQRIVLDAENKLPLEWSLFTSNKLLSVMRIQKLMVAAPTSDSLFALDVGEGGAKTLDGGLSGAERIQENMSALLSDASLSLPAVSQIRQAVQTLRRQCESLDQEVPVAESLLKSKSAAGANAVGLAVTPLRQDLARKAAIIEAIVDSLKKVEKGIEALESGAGSDNSAGKPISAPWRQCLSALDGSTSHLYELLSAEIPDMKAIARESASMRVQIGELEMISEELSGRI